MSVHSATSHGVKTASIASGAVALTNAQENPAASGTCPQRNARRRAQAGSGSGHASDATRLPSPVPEVLLCALPPILPPTTKGRCHRLSTFPFPAALQNSIVNQ